MKNEKVVLITGSTSGIGLGIARQFAKSGYKIVFNGLESNGAEVAENIGKEFGIEVMFSSANLTNVNEIENMINQAEEKFGSVDVLVNNAGVQYVSPVDDFPTEKWNLIISLNLTAAFHTTRLVWKKMKERKFGRIINIASAHGLVASEFKSAYVASKHGIIGFTKTIALEGAPFNITANAICPGYVKTPLVEKQIADQAKSHGLSENDVISKVMLYKQAVKEFIPVEILGDMSVLLASENSSTITGTSIPIDGGWNAQ
jgi:3-hydroxybutyrate dehydrogenase